MRLMNPIKQDQCNPLIGLPVCAILTGGSRHFGILSRTHSGKLYLNEDPALIESLVVKDNTKRGATKPSKTKAKVQLSTVASKEKGDTQPFGWGFPDFGPYGIQRNSSSGTKEVVELSSIAILFPLI